MTRLKTQGILDHHLSPVVIPEPIHVFVPVCCSRSCSSRSAFAFCLSSSSSRLSFSSRLCSSSARVAKIKSLLSLRAFARFNARDFGLARFGPRFDCFDLARFRIRFRDGESDICFGKGLYVFSRCYLTLDLMIVACLCVRQ